VVVRENPGGFRPKGSWPTADLVLPSKAGAMPSGFDDPRRVPTSIVRTRGVFDPIDVPDRPGIMSGRETEIIRARSPSELGARADTLPIDRSLMFSDPAEGPASLSGEARLRPKKSIVPLAAGIVIGTIAVAIFLLPRLESSDRGVRQPVLIEALPQPPDETEPAPRPEEKDVAALEALSEGDAPEEKEAEVEAPKAAKPPKVEQPREVEAPPKSEPKVEEPPKSRVVEAKLPDGDEPVVERPRKREKKTRKRSSAKAEPKREKEKEKEQPEKLEKGTLIDPFAE
jgi:hypothetical protein